MLTTETSVLELSGTALVLFHCMRLRTYSSLFPEDQLPLAAQFREFQGPSNAASQFRDAG